MATILVTGGRDYLNEARVYQILDAAVGRLGLTNLVHGDCPDGADALAKQWAAERGIPQAMYPADWDDLSQPDADIRTNRFGKRYDRKAGHRRNQRMLDEERPDHVIAFPGGPGTRDMVRRARAAGIEPILIDWNG